MKNITSMIKVSFFDMIKYTVLRREEIITL